MIGGYRSFYGEPQRVGPLTKVTLVAGPNNSGKSNILRAADRLLPSLESGRGKEFKLDDELDVPIMPDEGVDAPPFTLGVALRVQSGGHLDSLMSALPERPQAGTQGMQFVNQLAFAPAFRSTPADNELVWFRWWFDGQHLKRDDGQLEELADHMRNSGLENLISDMASTTFGRSEGTVADLGQFMDAWEGAVRIPPVAFVPAIRQIMIGDDFGPELRDTSGKGLPRMLQAWQAPSATRYLQDRRK